MIATSGVKSTIPARGITRRRGANIGSVTRNRIIASLFVGLGENHDNIARQIMAKESTSHRIRISSNKNDISA